MLINASADEPPLRSPRQLPQLGSSWRRLAGFFSRRAGGNKAYSISSLIAALALVSTSLLVNLNASHSLAAGVDPYVVPDPKLKSQLMVAMAPYIPVVSPALDANKIVTADITPKNLVLNKPTPGKTVTSDQVAAASAPAVQAPTDAPRTSDTTYTVQAGDTLSTIAQKFNLRQASIQVSNPDTITNLDALAIGDQLKIPATDFSDSYIKTQLAKQTTATAAKTAAASTKTVAMASVTRSVVVRDQAAPATGSINFSRPAGARGQNGYHLWAIDIPPTGGLGIYASADGTVEEVGSGWDGGYGNMIKIAHGGGWETLYAHLSQVQVVPGESVTRGEQIGVMGATGHVIPKGAVHLHFEIRKDGHQLNPINYIQ